MKTSTNKQNKEDSPYNIFTVVISKSLGPTFRAFHVEVIFFLFCFPTKFGDVARYPAKIIVGAAFMIF